MKLDFCQQFRSIEFQPTDTTLFALSEVSIEFVNMLRYSLLSEEKKIVFTQLDLLEGFIEKNDQMLEHVQTLTPEEILDRLVQIPLAISSSLLVARQSCECQAKGCELCCIEYQVGVYEQRMVYASDLHRSDSKESGIIYPQIPIVPLGSNQFFEAKIFAERRLSGENANFRSCTVCSYFPLLRVQKISKNKPNEATPVPIPKQMKSIEEIQIYLSQKQVAPGCYAVSLNSKPCIIDATESSDIVLSVETDGSISGLKLLSSVVQILIEKFEIFYQEITEKL